MDVSKITYTNKNFIKYKSNNLKIRTPPVRIPFGLEESYGKKILKLQLQNKQTELEQLEDKKQKEYEDQCCDECGIIPDDSGNCMCDEDDDY